MHAPNFRGSSGELCLRKTMGQPWMDDAKFFTSSLSSSHPEFSQSSCRSSLKHGHRNVYQLLALREISPRAKQHSKKLWGGTLKWKSHCVGPTCELADAKHALFSWVEAESLRHLSAKYCPLLPPPRSTIAAAFSSDGKTLASTHGDHTVKIIDCQTGTCLKVLSGHRRTPWVVRFHPLYPEILASGSLDHEVRLWNACTADCIGSRDFYRPIASIAFHARGELVAVASGHKLYIWDYSNRGEASSPTIVLKTRRSLRAVHFHPHAAPFLLTAEVNDLDSSDSPLMRATSPGYLQHPPVSSANFHSSLSTQLEANVPRIPSPYLLWPAFIKDDGRTPFQHGDTDSGFVNVQQRAEPFSSTKEQAYLNVGNQFNHSVAPMEVSPGEPACSSLLSEIPISDTIVETLETDDGQPTGTVQQRSSMGIARRLGIQNDVSRSTFQSGEVSMQMSMRQTEAGPEDTPIINSSDASSSADLEMLPRSIESGQLHQFIPFSDPAFWELPFLQGWLMGQTHAGLHVQGTPCIVRATGSGVMASDLSYTQNVDALVPSSALETNSTHCRGNGRSGSRHSRSRLLASTAPGEAASSTNAQIDEAESQPVPSSMQSQISTSLAAATELPCTVKLRIWPYDIQDPCAYLVPETCRLTIPHAVLCSEMGAHFSPCGRFLAACVACVLPHMEGDPGLQSQMHQDVTGVATSPTRHPISAHQVLYKLCIYSLEGATFGSVLASRAIRAAHCLTSIQFSPTSEHILLAYGRRHSSLLRSFLVEGETTVPIYTILEVYRVSDMELVRVLPSAEDEVNVACFHPVVGEGLVYGTKEGKLRILQFDSPHGRNCTGSNIFLEENMLEVQRFALEC